MDKWNYRHEYQITLFDVNNTTLHTPTQTHAYTVYEDRTNRKQWYNHIDNV